MEQLPYIDEHSIVIGATRERVWNSLPSVLRASFARTLPAPLTRLWGLTPARSHGERHGALEEGDALTGFTVALARAPEHLTLRGHHRFSNYELAFELDACDDDAGCTLRARTSAAFPGLTGRTYRALVIGSGAHRLLVRRLLRDVARRA